MQVKSLHRGSEECLQRLREAGWAAYPVGGCVRDLLLGRQAEDVDICTAARPEIVLALFERAIPTGLAHGTVTVLTETGSVEITTFRREGGYTDARHPDAVRFDVGLEEDLARRDFTVNAMALAPDGTVIDPFGGQEDLARRLIRCVGDPERRFSEDALRMLRGVRFCAQLGFTMEEQTAAALRRCAPLTARVSGERIRAELEKILLSDRPEQLTELTDGDCLAHLYDFPRGLDLRSLRELPAEPISRWRGFCELTGFPITRLPVERALRRGVEHPELAVIPTLALSGGDLIALGLRGAEVSAAQKRLALYVLEHPEANTVQRLRELVENQAEM